MCKCTFSKQSNALQVAYQMYNFEYVYSSMLVFWHGEGRPKLGRSFSVPWRLLLVVLVVLLLDKCTSTSKETNVRFKQGDFARSTRISRGAAPPAS